MHQQNIISEHFRRNSASCKYAGRVCVINRRIGLCALHNNASFVLKIRSIDALLCSVYPGFLVRSNVIHQIHSSGDIDAHWKIYVAIYEACSENYAIFSQFRLLIWRYGLPYAHEMFPNINSLGCTRATLFRPLTLDQDVLIHSDCAGADLCGRRHCRQ